MTEPPTPIVKPGRIITMPSEAEIRGAFDPYVTAIGRVAYAWNYLHEILGRLFAAVTGADPGIMLAVWYSTESDRTQREMLRAAIEAWAKTQRKSPSPDAYSDLLWLINEANKLADARNNAVHAPCSIYTSEHGTEVGAAFHTGHARARRLWGKNLIDEFLWCEECAETLSVFGVGAVAAFAIERNAWPHKPQIPSRNKKRTFEDLHRLRDVSAFPPP